MNIGLNMAPKFLILLCFINCYNNIPAQDLYIVQSNGLNVRSLPSSKSKILDELRRGDTIKVVSKKGNWLSFNFRNNELGYVNKAYLEVLSNNLETTTKKNLIKNDLSFFDLTKLSAYYYFPFLVCIVILALFKHYIL